MKKWILISILSVLIIGMVLTSGCTQDWNQYCIEKYPGTTYNMSSRLCEHPTPITVMPTATQSPSPALTTPIPPPVTPQPTIIKTTAIPMTSTPLLSEHFSGKTGTTFRFTTQKPLMAKFTYTYFRNNAVSGQITPRDTCTPQDTSTVTLSSASIDSVLFTSSDYGKRSGTTTFNLVTPGNYQLITAGCPSFSWTIDVIEL